VSGFLLDPRIRLIDLSHFKVFVLVPLKDPDERPFNLVGSSTLRFLFLWSLDPILK